MIKLFFGLTVDTLALTIARVIRDVLPDVTNAPRRFANATIMNPVRTT